MTEQEKIDNDIQMKLALQDAKVNVFMQEMSDFKEEMRDFKTEMRNRDNQRSEDMREIRASIDSIIKHVQSISTAAMIGVGASVIAVVVFVGTMVYTLVTR